MGKVIRSQLFELRKNRVIFIFAFGVLVICLATGWMLIEWTETKTVSEYIAQNGLQITSMFMKALIMVVTGFICAGDFPDKTINHEITSGTLRRDSFFGRAVLAIAAAVISAILILLLVTFILTQIYGWGDVVTVGSAMKRVALLIFPYFKLSCFGVLLSFIIKQPYAPLLVGMLVTFLTSIVNHATGAMTYIISEFSAGKICTYDYYMTYGLNSDAWYIYDESIDPHMITGLIAVSVLLGTAYLIISYHFFRKDDLN